ncbi:MAG: cytochrome c biosis protein, transrane region [Dehalococcoidia bacterium]|nr:cytochrome c biosis protein, transrane region [Dehalococcoidia bacterium]
MSGGLSLSSRVRLLVTLGVLCVVGGLLALGMLSNTGRIPGLEHYASSFATLLPFGYAFAAGMVASVNPCGFLMLPAFVGHQFGSTTSADAEMGFAHLGRGMLIGSTMTLGFLVLFASIGTAITVGGQALVASFPWIGLVIGVALTLGGLWLTVTGKSIGLAWASRVSPPRGKDLRAVFLYGMAYGAVSLSCTLPVFLVVVGTSLAASGFVASVGQFVSFALGMGAVIIAFTMAATTLEAAFTRSLRSVMPYFHRVSSLFLVGAGLYLIVYWVWLGEILA